MIQDGRNERAGRQRAILTFCSEKVRFCLLCGFGQTRENRIKWFQLWFGPFFRRKGLKTQVFRNCLIYKRHSFAVQCSLLIINGLNDNSSWQNRTISCFSPSNSAWKVSEFPLAKNKTPHAEITISVCGVFQRTMPSFFVRRVMLPFSPLRKVT